MHKTFGHSFEDLLSGSGEEYIPNSDDLAQVEYIIYDDNVERRKSLQRERDWSSNNDEGNSDICMISLQRAGEWESRR